MFLRYIMVSSFFTLSAFPALAQEYPTQTVTLVHGFSPGSNVDNIARIISDELSEGLGQRVIVESRPGAAGNIASASVANAEPDGYTIYLLIGGHTVSAAMYETLAFDPVEDFTFISTVSEFPFFVATTPGRFDSLEDLARQLREEPESLTVSSTGTGTTQHLTGELIGLRAGGRFTHVPYQGGAAAITAVLGGEVDVAVDAATVLDGHVRGGAIELMAVTSAERWESEPDVPTLAETILPGFDIMSWSGIVAPAGLPDEIVQRLHVEIVRVLEVPEVRDRLALLGSRAAPRSPEDFRAMIEQQIENWTLVVDEAGLEKL